MQSQNRNPLPAGLVFAAVLAACGGEPINVTLPEQKAPEVKVIVNVPEQKPGTQTSTAPCAGKCQRGTMCDAALNACVAMTPTTRDQDDTRCPDSDYGIAMLSRTATTAYRAGDEALLFQARLDICNSIELKELVVRVSATPYDDAMFHYVKVVDDQRDVGGVSHVGQNGLMVIGFSGYRFNAGQTVRLSLKGRIRENTPAGRYRVDLYAVFARRVSDDKIARLSTAYVGQTIQVKSGPPAQMCQSPCAREQYRAASGECVRFPYPLPGYPSVSPCRNPNPPAVYLVQQGAETMVETVISDSRQGVTAWDFSLHACTSGRLIGFYVEVSSPREIWSSVDEPYDATGLIQPSGNDLFTGFRIWRQSNQRDLMLFAGPGDFILHTRTDAYAFVNLRAHDQGPMVNSWQVRDFRLTMDVGRVEAMCVDETFWVRLQAIFTPNGGGVTGYYSHGPGWFMEKRIHLVRGGGSNPG